MNQTRNIPRPRQQPRRGGEGGGEGGGGDGGGPGGGEGGGGDGGGEGGGEGQQVARGGAPGHRALLHVRRARHGRAGLLQRAPRARAEAVRRRDPLHLGTLPHRARAFHVVHPGQGRGGGCAGDHGRARVHPALPAVPGRGVDRQGLLRQVRPEGGVVRRPRAARRHGAPVGGGG